MNTHAVVILEWLDRRKILVGNNDPEALRKLDSVQFEPFVTLRLVCLLWNESEPELFDRLKPLFQRLPYWMPELPVAVAQALLASCDIFENPETKSDWQHTVEQCIFRFVCVGLNKRKGRWSKDLKAITELIKHVVPEMTDDLMFDTSDRPILYSASFAALKVLRHVSRSKVPPPNYTTRFQNLIERGLVKPWHVSIFKWWPPADREKILLESSQPIWLFIPSCMTPPVLQKAVTWVARSTANDASTAEQALIAVGSPIKPYVEKALIQGAGKRRHLLLNVLSTMADADSVPTLIAMFDDGRQANRKTASEILVRLGFERAGDAVFEALCAGRHRVRMCAASTIACWEKSVIHEALKRVSDPKARAILEASKTDNSPMLERIQLSLAQRNYTTADVTRLRRSYRSPSEGVEALLLMTHIIRIERWCEPYLGSWWRLVEHYQSDVLAPMAALWALDVLTSQERNVYIVKFKDLFGERARDAIVELCQSTQYKQRGWLYAWACTAFDDLDVLHSKMLECSLEATRQQAARMLATSPKGLDRAQELLTSKHINARHGGAQLLRALASPHGLPIIEHHLSLEKSKRVREALEEAQRWCDPILRKRVGIVAESFGAYTIGEPLQINSGLEELRRLIHDDDATEMAWLRLCNLLERFRRAGGLELALPYVTTHGLERWPKKQRIAPWGWDSVPELEMLLPRENGLFRNVVLVETLFYTDDAKQFVEEARADMERRLRARLFEFSDVAIFQKWVGRGWAWCEQHGIPFDQLHVRVDGGSVGKMHAQSIDSSALELWQGYGARIGRFIALRENVRGRLHGLRLLRIQVPRKHPIREEFELGNRKKYMDLVPVLGAEDDRGVLKTVARAMQRGR